MNLFLIAFCLFPVLLWAATCLWFLRPLRLPRLYGRICVLLLLLASQKLFWFQFIGGNTFKPEIPFWLHAALSWGSSFAGCLFLLNLLPPYPPTAKALAGGPRPAICLPSLRAARIRGAIVACAAALLAAYMVYGGARQPSITRIDIDIDGLPQEFDGFRIAHLADLHACSSTSRERFARIARDTNGLEPDVICIAGDIVDGVPQERGDVLSPLSDLRAPFGVFACAGNHEAYYRYDLWKPIFESYGIRMLDDSGATLRRGGAAIALGGLIDRPFDSMPGSPAGDDRVAAAFSGTEGATRILLRHRPIGLAAATANGVDLQLSGHTHGGQVPGVGLLMRRPNEGHVRGVYRENGTTLNVSRGSGQWAGFPYRLFINQEITLITLHPSKADAGD